MIIHISFEEIIHHDQILVMMKDWGIFFGVISERGGRADGRDGALKGLADSALVCAACLLRPLSSSNPRGTASQVSGRCGRGRRQASQGSAVRPGAARNGTLIV